MGAPIPSMRLIGEHRCHVCNGNKGPHYVLDRRIYCFCCDRQRMVNGIILRTVCVVCFFLLAVIATAAAFAKVFFP